MYNKRLWLMPVLAIPLAKCLFLSSVCPYVMEKQRPIRRENPGRGFGHELLDVQSSRVMVFMAYKPRIGSCNNSNASESKAQVYEAHSGWGSGDNRAPEIGARSTQVLVNF